MSSKKRQFTLIGYPLSHSFSQKYFTEKFEREQISNHEYFLSPLEKIEDFPNLLSAHPNLAGLNVTIPYKEKILPFLDEISEEAKAIGAVNTIKIKDGKLKGFNTDVYGFEKSLLDLLSQKQKNISVENALVLGTGGAAKAVVFILKKLGINPIVISRKKEKGDLTYDDLDTIIFDECRLIVNTTPLGMLPNVDSCPNLPFHRINAKYYLYDLVYNPEKTVFLTRGESQGASIKNGLEMLHLQAEKSWEIWNEE
ncbi:MAG: shikimate dehydrogenase [Saprospiraceae bacterium]